MGVQTGALVTRCMSNLAQPVVVSIRTLTVGCQSLGRPIREPQSMTLNAVRRRSCSSLFPVRVDRARGARLFAYGVFVVPRLTI
eukprot:813813-Rhodomonas_salina.1